MAFVSSLEIFNERDVLIHADARLDRQAGSAAHDHQFSKLGFTVQLVPRYALLVRDQGCAAGEGRSDRTILTQSRGCERHAVPPLRFTPLHAAPRRAATAPAHYAGLCGSSSSLPLRCERPRLDSIRLRMRACMHRVGVAGRHADNDNPRDARAALSDDRYFIVNIPTLTLFAVEREWSVTEIASVTDAIYIVYFMIMLNTDCVPETATLTHDRGLAMRSHFRPFEIIPMLAIEISYSIQLTQN